jgi:predicted transcriptional regulator
MTIHEIAVQEGMCDQTVRRWAKEAGFILTRGNKNVSEFDEAQVKRILSFKKSGNACSLSKWLDARDAEADRRRAEEERQ